MLFLTFFPLQKTVAVAGASECDILNSKKTFKISSRVEAGASSNVKAISFRDVCIREVSIDATLQVASFFKEAEEKMHVFELDCFCR